ncbi:MAG: DUF1573 domain-containing protein [Lentimicrobiaceae bacterium]|nr:DUF1573 domain-containing protein [Lentimicrobiaceae bacterium]
MKKLIVLTTILLLVFSFAFAQEPVKNQAPDKNAPEISFNKIVHDYGTILQEGDGNCEFEFKNTGKEPLVLTSVTSSCGCTIPEWPRKPILPRKSDVIKVKYDTKRTGKFAKQVTVVSNAKNSTIVLKIQGEVVDKNTTQAPIKDVNKGTMPVAK